MSDRVSLGTREPDKETEPNDLFADGEQVPEDADEVRRNIQLIIRIRWIVSPAVFLIMIGAYLTGLSGQGSLSENQIIVNSINLGALLVLNLAYVGMARRATNLRPLILFQLLIDVIHMTLTVYKTGGVVSPFGFLFFFVIFEAAILRSGRAAFAIATISGVLYSLTTLLERIGWLPHQDYFSPLSGLVRSDPFIVLTWAFSIASFFGFAALAAYLTELLKRRQRRLHAAYGILTKRHETLMLLHRTTKALNTFHTSEEIANSILGELLTHLNLDRALLYLVAKRRKLQLFMVKRRDGTDDNGAARGGPSVTIPLEEGAGLTARCAILQEAFNVEDPESSEHINKDLARKIGLNPFALAPMVIRGKTLGVVGIDRSRDNGAILNEEFRILQVFANQAAIALHSVDPSAPVFQP